MNKPEGISREKKMDSEGPDQTCGETQCLYGREFFEEGRFKAMCMYCDRFVRRQKLFLNNVG